MNSSKFVYRCFVLSMIFCVISLSSSGQAIIADHNVVDDYDIIPQEYIDSVKKMFVTVPGESHSLGYRLGLEFLEVDDNRFQVNITTTGTPEAYTDQYLRFSRATWGRIDEERGWYYGYGEEDWFTTTLAIERTKAGITYANSNGLVISAMGFGWCWDLSRSIGGSVDPVYQTRWGGRSLGGEDGNTPWGLDKEDSVLTGNRINLNTYLNATEEYIAYCEQNNYPTIIFFTTGPVDHNTYNSGELGYQRHIKTEHIRDYVEARGSGYLFDYSDILCWNNSGEYYTREWTDYASVVQDYEFIHPDNMVDLDGSYSSDGDHIGEVGTVRLAKAMWWMLARMAGWNGLPEGTDVEAPSVPENLDLVSYSSTTATIGWDNSTDNVSVAGYIVYRDDTAIDTTITNEYTDSGLILGNSYFYTISAIDAANNESEESSSLVVNTSDLEAPSVPLNLVTTVNGVTSADLAWDISTDNIAVVGYRVYRDEVIIDTSLSNSYTDNGLTVGNVYSYNVAAFDAAGNVSDTSAFSEVNTADVAPPQKPSGLMVSTESSISVYLSWELSTDNVGVEGYSVYRDGILIGASLTNGYSDNSLVSGNTYMYNVSAYDAAGNESLKSDSVLVNTSDIVAPSTPADVKARCTSIYTAELSWSASTDNVSVSGYRVLRNGVVIDTSLTTDYSDSGLSVGQNYSYTVYAYDAAGNVSNASIASEVFTSDTVLPTTPENLMATEVSFTDAYITWDKATDNDTVFEYRIFRGDLEIGTNDSNQFHDNSLSIGNTYTYTVSAIDASNNESAVSAPLIISTKDTDSPTVPQNLKVNKTSVTTAVLTWDESTDNVSVSGYRIFRNGFALDTSLVCTFIDKNLTIGNTYTYSVTSFDDESNESDQAATAEVTMIDTYKPTKPENLRCVVLNYESIKITWEASIDDVEVVGYFIFKNNELLDTVNTLSFIDENIQLNAFYSYAIVAFDSLDNESDKSEIMEVHVVDTVRPSIPQNLMANTTNDSTAFLSWEASIDDVGVVGYRIYKDGEYFSDCIQESYTDVEVIAGGSYLYSLTAYDAAGNESDYSETYHLEIQNPLSRMTIGFEDQIQVFPSIITTYLNLKVVNISGSCLLTIYSSLGKLVYEEDIDVKDSTMNIENLNLEKGHYLIRLTNQKRVYLKHFIVL